MGKSIFIISDFLLIFDLFLIIFVQTIFKLSFFIIENSRNF